jgi:parallel beta-helix repeat protein
VRKSAFLLVLLLLVFSVLVTFSQIASVKAKERTIYLRADGSIEGTVKIGKDGNVYTFSGDLNASIIVEISNIQIDGAGFTLQGTGTEDSKGITLSEKSNVTIMNLEITNFYYGIYLKSSSNNNIQENNVTKNEYGIELWWLCSGNTISGNNLIDNVNGIRIQVGSNNILTGNYITKNNIGVTLDTSGHNTVSLNYIADNEFGMKFPFFLEVNEWNNSIHHNSFVNNNKQYVAGRIHPYGWPPTNTWYDSMSGEGNYWSDYNGTDSDGDGIGDTPYIVDEHNKDNFPLMEPAIIPEFPSWLILPLFLMATFSAIIIKKKLFHQRS